jgi:hypothetical protein
MAERQMSYDRGQSPLSEEDLDMLGSELAELLGLRKKRNGRYNTAWGDKTPRGLWLTVRNTMREREGEVRAAAG